jgi:DNA-binding CsgD family transcriptional regulator/tetratricopeptide (TPR) repeat protein
LLSWRDLSSVRTDAAREHISVGQRTEATQLPLSENVHFVKSAGEYKAERRRKAVADGLCHTCCVVKVPSKRAICAKCSADATARSARRRLAIRSRREMERGITTLETAGDAYASDGDYRAAMKTYERAFTLSAEDVPAHTRLAAKLGRSAFLAGVGTGTDDWFNISLEEAVRSSATPTSIADLYTQQARVLWSTSRTAEIIALSERVLGLAKVTNNVELMCLSRLWLASVVHHLSRYDEAKCYLEAIDVRTLPQDPKILCMYERVSGFVYTSSGNAEMAFASFGMALQYAEQDRDPFACATILIASAIAASSLGRIDLAVTTFLEALTISRDNNLMWNVAYISLEYARLLSRQGNRHLAHAYAHQATTYENAPPFLIEALAEIGIPIALECGDAYLLERCANEDALTFAFRSGEPQRIGPVAASFARYYQKVGRAELAQEVLTKALGWVTNADQCYDLPMAAAEFGDARHFLRAREVLRTRTLLPNASVAVAHIHAFDALVHHRQGNVEASSREGAAASTLFRNLKWSSHESAATLLCASVASESRSKRGQPPLVLGSFGLSLREESVARLAMAEFSNREIADKLSITVKTVENHMTSILRRMGLRCRHQLLQSVDQ